MRRDARTRTTGGARSYRSPRRGEDVFETRFARAGNGCTRWHQICRRRMSPALYGFSRGCESSCPNTGGPTSRRSQLWTGSTGLLAPKIHLNAALRFWRIPTRRSRVCIRQGGPRAFFDTCRHCLRRQHQCTQRKPLCRLGSAVFEPRCIGDCSASRSEILPRRAVWAGARGLSARTRRPLVSLPLGKHMAPRRRATREGDGTGESDIPGRGCWKRPAASRWSAT
jgi:hypothetical protein